MNRWVPLADILNDRNLGNHCAAIIKSVHIEWNNQIRFDHQVLDVADYVRLAMQDYLESGGGLDVFLREAGLSLEAPPQFLSFPGRKEQLPNPLVLLQPSDMKVEVWYGMGHGDLHVHNLIVPTGPVNPDLYKLLDLGRFSTKAPLARDPMKLLGSVAVQWLSDLVPETNLRRLLAELIVEPDKAEETPPTIGYHEVSRCIHAASEVLALKSDAGHDWPAQKLIALAVVALRLTSQPARFRSLADRWWFFEVAALATRAFRKCNHTTPSAIHETAVEDRSGVGDPTAGDETPHAKVIPLRPRTSPDAVPELLVQLLQGIEDLPGSASDERLADIGEGLRALATQLDQVLADTQETFEIQLELRAVRELLIRLSNVVTARKVLPNVRRAGEELRRCANQRWVPAQG